MRPPKIRHIDAPPPWRRYLPEGWPDAAEVPLGLDMFEALRLVDAEGLSQEAAAARMGISPPTLCRLLGEARRRVATALRDGWALCCEGGSVAIRPGGRPCVAPGGPAGRGPHGGRRAGRSRHGPGRQSASPAAGGEALAAEARGRAMVNPESGEREASGARRVAARDGAGGSPRPGRGRGHGCGPGRGGREDAE